MKRQPLRSWRLLWLCWRLTATAAETCYQDDTGRIVKRRRPGYTEVPCPDESAQPGRDAVRCAERAAAARTPAARRDVA